MNNVILPSKLHRAVLLWLSDYAITPMLRMVAGYQLPKVSAWYNRVFTKDLTRFSEQLRALMAATDKQVTMTLKDDGRLAVFHYQPDDHTVHLLSIDDILEPVAELSKTYRRDYAVEAAKNMGFPKKLLGLIQRCDDSDNEMRIVIKHDDPDYSWLDKLSDAALLEDYLKREKKLMKLEVPIHKLESTYLYKTGYRGIYFQFTNRLSIQFFAENHNWTGDFTLVVSCPEIEAERLFRLDLEKLKLPEPDKQQGLVAKNKRNLMSSPLLYKQNEIWVQKMGNDVTVNMTSEEDFNKRGSSPLSVTATLLEWQELFKEMPKLARHLAKWFEPPKSGRTFNINGQSFTEGDWLTIITPEFGTIPTTTTIQSYSHGSVVGLALTPLSNGPTCQANLSLYTNGNGYHTLQLAYLCSCAHNVHRRYYEWFDWKLEGFTVTTGQAREEKPLAPLAIPPRKDLPKPEPVVVSVLVAQPVESAKVNAKGQFQLF